MMAQPEWRVLVLMLGRSSPVEVWLAHIRDKQTRARILRQIDKMGRGIFGDWKSLGDGVFEMRLDFGPGYRVYYAKIGNTVILLLGGGHKGTQSSDIQSAKAALEQFVSDGSPEYRIRELDVEENNGDDSSQAV